MTKIVQLLQNFLHYRVFSSRAPAVTFNRSVIKFCANLIKICKSQFPVNYRQTIATGDICKQSVYVYEYIQCAMVRGSAFIVNRLSSRQNSHKIVEWTLLTKCANTRSTPRSVALGGGGGLFCNPSSEFNSRRLCQLFRWVQLRGGKGESGQGEEGFVMGFWPSKSLGPRPCRILFKVNIYMPRTQATLADNWRESWRGKMGEECEGGCGGRRQEEEESGRSRGRRQRQRQQILVICSCFLRPAKVSTTTTTTTTRVALHRTTTRTLKGASAGASSIEGDSPGTTVERQVCWLEMTTSSS